MQNLFISYRRDDAAAWARRLCSRMARLLGSSRVFVDVEAIQPGRNCTQAIESTLVNCSYVLVVIAVQLRDASFNDDCNRLAASHG